MPVSREHANEHACQLTGCLSALTRTHLQPLVGAVQRVPDSQDGPTPSEDLIVDLDCSQPQQTPTAAALLELSPGSPPRSPPQEDCSDQLLPRRKRRSRQPDSPEWRPDYESPPRSERFSGPSRPGEDAEKRPAARKSARLSDHSSPGSSLPDLPASTLQRSGSGAAQGKGPQVGGPAAAPAASHAGGGPADRPEA